MIRLGEKLKERGYNAIDIEVKNIYIELEGGETIKTKPMATVRIDVDDKKKIYLIMGRFNI
ncbi:hypothetical protein [Sulfurisphaera ohwakuensis]|uniref:Uncharacterized protein n=1 Tax=Sulfurisphaera ohwakuensis TaxID=69656 RepID=A0A650CDX4_SULOH|nr:hypothetical protein [Sulfurisphaera ohwakuensis]MBB5253098.1 hypothetical protein [Sulfurisphaera ohwakuensis]QGR15982.1 hypothetical protein D1869_01385 [Sulfurisphaera ohwakuensis]